MNQLHASFMPLSRLEAAPRLATPARDGFSVLNPALEMLTDFLRVAPRTIRADADVNEAHLMMRHGGFRLLLVTDDQQCCIGVLAAREVIGGRRITLAQQQHGLSSDEVTVGMIMTPWQKLSAMPLEQLATLTIGDLLLSLESMTDQHLLVTERDQQGSLRIRGLVSAADIRRAVGRTESATPEVATANSFADTYRMMMGHDL
ncbi:MULTISPECIES: CBS domain-containing protein [unclassified Halomonas]|uniref:CBS domain-containing protein n=1 Tax=unclassified Halomonas TaxID=2609666 RepID=UPI0028879992|nr:MULTISPECIES: CBS domain-containing protein [unclassified Halomonas]MDT0500022.1 CBS domain-containing protein [Halomonas sp. PAR7]MDT0512426.1 CBS domain-containing protein [Halomonas sp. LES1]MDT0591060.1 CBS domain-containing protein [Halomonas sp. PAR8]